MGKSNNPVLTLSLVEEAGAEPDGGASIEKSEQAHVDAETSLHTEHSMSPQPLTPHTASDSNTIDVTGSVGTATSTAFACPKCKTEQAESDECIKCGIIINKYQHPRDRIKARKAATKRVEFEADAGFFSSWAFKGMLAVLLAASAYFFFADSLKDSESVVEFIAHGPQYRVKANVSENSVRLLDLSGTNDTLVETPLRFKALFARDFPAKAKSRGTSPANIELILSKVPKAYNANAAQAALGSWTDLRFNESQIDALLKIYETPSVERFVQASRERNPENDKVEFEAFISELQKSPLTAARTRALERLVDTLGLDKMALTLAGEASSSVIELSASVVAYPDTLEVQQKTNREIEQMLESLSWMKSEVRALVIGSLAWQLEHFSTPEINMLNKNFDTPVHRDFMHECTRGFEQFFYDATMWLELQARRANPNL